MKQPVREAARGKWKSILTNAKLGNIDSKILDGKHHPCPVTGEGADRFRFSDRNGTGTFFCACSEGKGDGFDLLKCCQGWDFATAAKEIEKEIGSLKAQPKQERSEESIRADLRAIKKAMLGDPEPVLTYLRSRAIDSPALPWPLRFGRLSYAIRDLSANPLGAMISLVQDGNGKVVTFHITYLVDDFSARVDHPRAKVVATPLGDMRGSAVRLFPVGEDGVLGIGEGIESSLSASELFAVPTWAGLNANNLENFVWPENLKKLIVFGDNDATTFTGQAAAYKLAHRAATSKRKVPEVEVYIPPPGKDWNDVLRESKRGS